MKYPKNWTGIVEYTLRAKRFEATSVKGQVVRHNVGHRFEINSPGAKSATEVMAENIASNNTLLSAILKKKRVT